MLMGRIFSIFYYSSFDDVSFTTDPGMEERKLSLLLLLRPNFRTSERGAKDGRGGGEEREEEGESDVGGEIAYTFFSGARRSEGKNGR